MKVTIKTLYRNFTVCLQLITFNYLLIEIVNLVVHVHIVNSRKQQFFNLFLWEYHHLNKLNQIWSNIVQSFNNYKASQIPLHNLHIHNQSFCSATGDGAVTIKSAYYMINAALQKLCFYKLDQRFDFFRWLAFYITRYQSQLSESELRAW